MRYDELFAGIRALDDAQLSRFLAYLTAASAVPVTLLRAALSYAADPVPGDSGAQGGAAARDLSLG